MVGKKEFIIVIAISILCIASLVGSNVFSWKQRADMKREKKALQARIDTLQANNDSLKVALVASEEQTAKDKAVMDTLRTDLETLNRKIIRIYDNTTYPNYTVIRDYTFDKQIELLSRLAGDTTGH